MRGALAAFLRDDSGQALFEAVFFIPIVIFGIASVIFFSQLGVLSERSESAVRYGNDVSYRNGNQLYSVASVYALLNELQSPGSDPLGALCVENPAAVATPASQTNTKIQNDIRAALVQAQDPAANAPGPIASAKPYWKPVASSVSVPGCMPNTVRLMPASSTGESNAATSNGGLPLSTAGLSVSSSVTEPEGMQFMMGALNLETSAHETFLNVAAPNTLLACSPGAQVALTALNGGVPLTNAQNRTLNGFCPSAP